MAVLGLRCCMGFCLVGVSRCYCLFAVWGLRSSCCMRASHCSGFPCCAAEALVKWASVVAAQQLSSCNLWVLECRLDSCGHRLSCSMPYRIFPDQGSNLSPTLEGRFLTTGPPWKSLVIFIFLLDNWRIIALQCVGLLVSDVVVV